MRILQAITQEATNTLATGPTHGLVSHAAMRSGRELGRGSQYKVLDLCTGRVRKVPLTYQESQAVIASWYAGGRNPGKESAAEYRQLLLSACKDIKRLLDRYPELAHTFGHPQFERGGRYTQDKSETLGRALEHCSSLAAAEELIDAFIELTLLHWSYGFSDYVFKFTANNGVNDRGQVVQLDFGEITFDKRQVARAIASRKWRLPDSHQGKPGYERHAYYSFIIERRLTKATLDAVWGSALDAPQPALAFAVA